MKNHSRIIRALVCAALLISMAACSSAKERGDKAMESGNFDDAVRHYETAVKRNPNDPEAVAALKKAREEFLGQKLIQARLARQGGNMQESMDLLLGVVQKESEWNFFPGGKVAFTQEEESVAVSQHAKQLVTADLKAGHPLKAEIFLRKYKPVIAAKQLGPIQASVNKAGKDHCRDLNKSIARGKPYFTRWVANYCGFWGQPLSTTTADTLSESLYGDVKVSVKDTGLSAELQAMIGQALDGALTKTPWYDPQGKHVVEARINGSFNQSRNKHGQTLIHTYDDQEQYIESVAVERERTVTFTEWVNGVSYARQRQEKYTVHEPQVKYRPIKKDFRYPAWKHEQQLTIDLGGELLISGKSLDISINEKLNSDGIEHDENQPKIGLTPARPTLPNPTEWQKEQVGKFAESFAAKAAKLWRDSYCDVDASATTVADSGNRVAMCLRHVAPNEGVPPFADEWYVKTTGVGSRQAIELIEGARKSGKSM